MCSPFLMLQVLSCFVSALKQQVLSCISQKGFAYNSMKMAHVFRYMTGHAEPLSLRLIPKFTMTKLIYKDSFHVQKHLNSGTSFNLSSIIIFCLSATHTLYSRPLCMVTPQEMDLTRSQKFCSTSRRQVGQNQGIKSSFSILGLSWYI